MTTLLEQAIERLRQVSPERQDSAARALISQLEEEPEPSEREVIEEGRREFARGDFVSLKDWRLEMGLSDH